VDIAKQFNDLIINVTRVERICLSASLTMQPHFLPEYQIVFIHKGKGSMTINEDRYPVEAGKLFFLHKGKRIQVDSEIVEPIELYKISFSYKSSYQSNAKWQLYKEEGLAFPIEGELVAENPSQMLRLFEQLEESMMEQEELRPIRQSGLMMELIYLVLKELREQKHDAARGMSYTIEYLKENYMNNNSLELLSSMAGFSPSYYSRLFKKMKGVSPSAYITQLRIERAKELLVISNRSFQDIAQSVGYNEESYFSRMFKKETGDSPAQYLKNNRKKIAILRHSFNGDLLALGVTPHASARPKYWQQFHFNEELTNAGSILAYKSLNLDALIAFGPDLIVSGSERRGQNNELSLIAPTVIIPYWDMEWKARLLQIANVIGKQKEAKTWLARYNKKAAQAAAAIKAEKGDQSLLILRIIGGKLRVYGTDRNVGAVLYQDLKFTPPKEVRGISWRRTIQLEELPQYDADLIFVMCSSKNADLELWKQLQASAEWNACAAVRNSQWYQIDLYPWIDYSARSHELMIDSVQQLLVSEYNNQEEHEA